MAHHFEIQVRSIFPAFANSAAVSVTGDDPDCYAIPRQLTQVVAGLSAPRLLAHPRDHAGALVPKLTVTKL